MTAKAAPKRQFSWNGLSLLLAPSLQLIVSGTNHLIIEHDFEGLLELRWQKVPLKKHDSLIEDSISQLHKTSKVRLKRSKPNTWNADFFTQYTIQCYCPQDNTFPLYLFLSCQTCSMFLMMIVHSPGGIQLDAVQNISCHHHHQESHFWSIQDIQLQIPKRYTLSHYSIKAGFTTLFFIYKSSTIHICRLAPATLRLQQNSLSEILGSLIGIDTIILDHDSTDSELLFSRSPSLLQQIVERIRRKNPFIRASLRHDKQCDRLLGVMMEDIAPLAEDEFDMIRKSYETVQRQ